MLFTNFNLKTEIKNGSFIESMNDSKPNIQIKVVTKPGFLGTTSNHSPTHQNRKSSIVVDRFPPLPATPSPGYRTIFPPCLVFLSRRAGVF